MVQRGEVLVVFHGNGGNLSHRGRTMLDASERLGVSVLVFDYPGYGKTPGKPVGCLPSWRSNDMVVIDDNTVVFRDTARRVYRNDFRGGACSQLGNGFYTLVTKSTGSGLCSGDLAQVVDVKSGFTVGSCVIGDFVPYEGPRN